MNRAYEIAACRDFMFIRQSQQRTISSSWLMSRIVFSGQARRMFWMICTARRLSMAEKVSSMMMIFVFLRSALAMRASASDRLKASERPLRAACSGRPPFRRASRGRRRCEGPLRFRHPSRGRGSRRRDYPESNPPRGCSAATDTPSARAGTVWHMRLRDDPRA